MRVLVPVGRRVRAGIISSLQEESGLPSTIRCKPIIFPLDGSPFVSSELMAVIRQQALRQGQSQGEVWRHILPVGLRSSRARIATGEGAMITEKELSSMPQGARNELCEAILRGDAKFLVTQLDRADLEQYALAVDPPWPVRPAARRQREVLDYLYENGQQTRRQLIAALGAWAGAILSKLREQGLLDVHLADISEEDALLEPPQEAVCFTAEQEAAIHDLSRALLSGSPEYRLLHGITGSGKTAVYMRIARQCLENGRSVILLAPEVALAHKLFQDVEKNLPDYGRIIYHGYQAAVQRERIYRRVGENAEPVIVVGTRSAIFLPVFRPGCIIMDEEHDGSYKQDENFSYHAREIAWVRTQLNEGLLVMGSATPDLRTFHASENGHLVKLVMANRVGAGNLPKVELVNPGPGSKVSPEDSVMSGYMEDALVRCMEAGEQAVVLLNRRGYAPLIFCVSCQQPLRCPNCQIGLAYHKSINRAMCHFCGYSIEWPTPCPQCGGNNFITLGEGTERIAERLEVLAGKPVLRLDRDSVRRPGRIQEILGSFARGESPFLVGTQMLSKGHHFPNVTLVAVADGDIGLNLPDYRAAERTFQLLVQAAGRAGRGCKPGQAIIQTRNPDHYCWQHILNYDYAGFYQAELARRKRYGYPPFVKLGLLRITFMLGDEAAEEGCQELGKYLRERGKALKIRVLGPVAAPIGVINGKKRMQCLLKGQEWDGMRQIMYLAERHPAAKRLHLFLDLDPVNMM